MCAEKVYACILKDEIKAPKSDIMSYTWAQSKGYDNVADLLIKLKPQILVRYVPPSEALRKLGFDKEIVETTFPQHYRTNFQPTPGGNEYLADKLHSDDESLASFLKFIKGIVSDGIWPETAQSLPLFVRRSSSARPPIRTHLNQEGTSSVKHVLRRSLSLGSLDPGTSQSVVAFSGVPILLDVSPYGYDPISLNLEVQLDCFRTRYFHRLETVTAL
jgi:hypothetical protein